MLSIVSILLLGIGVLLTVGLLAFWIFTLIDCLQNEPDQGNDKLVWTLVIVFLGWIGALVYHFARKPNRPLKQSFKNQHTKPSKPVF